MKRISFFIVFVFSWISIWTSAAVPAYATSICPKGEFNNLCNINVGKLGNVIGVVVQVMLIIAIILCLFFLIYGGIRWITSGGDKGQIAQARATLTAAVVGLIISLLAFFILNVVLLVVTGKGLTTLTIPTLLQ